MDRNFHSLMHRRFGEAFARLPVAVTGPESKFMREFEGIKKEFGRSSASPLPLSLVMDGVSYSGDYARGEIKLSKLVIFKLSFKYVRFNDIQIAKICRSVLTQSSPKFWTS